MVRGSLGDVTLSRSAAVKGSYPLYAMPVPTLLSLDKWSERRVGTGMA